MVVLLCFEISSLQLVMSRRRELRISRGDSQLAVENGYIVVPGDTHDAVIGVTKLFDVPIYWRLPEMFLGDKESPLSSGTPSHHAGEGEIIGKDIFCQK